MGCREMRIKDISEGLNMDYLLSRRKITEDFVIIDSITINGNSSF